VERVVAGFGELLVGDKSVDTEVFSLLRKRKPMRQIEAVELMSAMNNYTARYAHALLATTRREDLAEPDRPKNIRGLTPEQMARMEREMDGLQREFKAVAGPRGTVETLIARSHSMPSRARRRRPPHGILIPHIGLPGTTE
jgi:hypothetical protein